MRANGVDGDQRSREFEPLQEAGDGGDLVALVGDRLPAEHEALTGGPGRDGVQGGAPCGPGVAAPGGLAVDGDEIGLGLAQAFDPRREAGLEEVGVERLDDVVEGVVGGQTEGVGQESAQEAQALLAPEPDLDEVVHAAQRGAQDLSRMSGSG